MDPDETILDPGNLADDWFERQDIGPDEGVDLGSELPELPGQADQPWPCYSWIDDRGPDILRGFPIREWDMMKRVDELDEKLQATEDQEDEEDKDNG